MPTRAAIGMLVQARASADGSDADLLGRYARDRDGAAFAELVRRHGPMVWATARGLLGREADAEAAFQATFLVLVRSAGRLGRVRSVGGWLHGTAVRVAWKARRAAARRDRRERAAAVPEGHSGEVPAAAWEAMHAALHEEVGRLPAAEREAFVRCGLGDRPLREAADHLGRTPGAVAGLLARARQKLVDRLTRRGFPLGAVGVGAVPAGLSAKAVAVGSAAGVPIGVSQLAEGVMGMGRVKVRLAVLGLVAAGGLGVAAGGGLVVAQPPAEKAADKPAPLPAAERPPAVAPLGRSKFDYEPVLGPAPTVAEFEAAVAEREAAGWEYVGTQEMTLTAADFASDRMKEIVGKRKVAAVRVYRRPAAAAKAVLLPLPPAGEKPKPAADPAAGPPADWYGGGDGYELLVDKEVKHEGKASGTVKRTGGGEDGFGTLTQAFDAAKYRGKRVRMSAHVKTAGVDGIGAGLWMRVDGKEKTSLAFDNMLDRPVKGTTDWKKVEVVLDVPDDAAGIFFGFLVAGPGQGWVDGFTFEVVKDDVKTTGRGVEPEARGADNPPPEDLPKEPKNLDFEK